LFGARYLAPDLPFLQAAPAVFRDLNALFLIAVGAGFYWPWRDPHAFRGYMWIMGAALKTAGAAVFVLYYLAGSPAAFLLFAATDAVLAIATLGALHITRSDGGQPVGWTGG
jgi:hypothetical protein